MEQQPNELTVPEAVRNASHEDAGVPAVVGSVPPVELLLAQGWLPLRHGEARVLVAVSGGCDERLHRDVGRWFPDDELSVVAMDHAAVEDRILRERSTEIADLMANGFTRQHPELAAQRGAATWQKIGAVTGAAMVTWLTVAAPAVILTLFTALFVVYTLVHVSVSVVSLLPRRRRHQAPADPPLAEEELPHYTVVVPAYHEMAVIGDLVRHLATLDYPLDRLDVLILVEQHDPGTRKAALAADPPCFVRIVELPPGPPQTKPRSCNLGLLLARSELLVIFDAEDRPDLDQLRKVAARFAAARDDRLACVQAKLHFHNATTNLLTRLFAMEYALRYDMTTVGLARMRLPISLGGSSNHFRVDFLRAAGGWDAWNVTEDADLGMRYAGLGYRTEMIDSETWEEAIFRLGPFLRQRTRWLKGFLMTTVVHTRQPVATLRRFGPRGMVTLLGIVGASPLTSFTQPIAVGLAVLGVTGMLWSPVGVSLVTPAVIAQLTATVGWIVLTIIAAIRRRVPSPWLALLLPAYWVLWWVAAWRATIQFVRSPFTWEKTPHGQR